MLAFILPLKPKSQSKNWEGDCALLKQTLQSILNQTSDNFKIYVVFSDDSNLSIHSEKITFIQFPFPFYAFEQIPKSATILPHFSNDKTMLERRWDKSKKILYGCKMAREHGCDYIMSVDADDLISNKLVKYIENRIQREDVPGFYINKGFLLNNGNKRMIKINEGMQNFNGSTHIIRSDFVPIPDFNSGLWMDYNLFTSHGWILRRLKEQYGILLEVIPFPAVIYVAHGGNISNVSKLNFNERVKRLVKLVIRGKTINAATKKEFMISG